MAEECKVECIQEVKHRGETIGGEEPGREADRVVLPSRSGVLPPFLERLMGRKA